LQLSLASACYAASDKATAVCPGVDVHKTEPVVARHIDHLPRRTLGKTFWKFACDPQFDYDITKKDGQVTLKITSVKMNTALKCDQQIPIEHTAKLQAHEDGHVAVAKRIYETAEKYAKEACANVIGKSVTANTEAAAVEKATTLVCDHYNKKVGLYCDAVEAAYDKITYHGLLPIKEKAAIEQAFKQVPRP